MALTSPGVEVQIIDQSQYLPAPTNSVPLVVLATAQNKADPNGAGVAQATLASNANKLYQVTSQRDLVTLYGTPFFYTTTNGTPIQGYELNEYGLLAAYSLLGVTNRCYVLRADIDLASLVGQTGRPTGEPANGTYWLDTTTSTWGINEWNATTSKFVTQTPIVITDANNLDGAGYPLSSIGNIGDYAVNAIQIIDAPLAYPQYFYKNSNNSWTALGGVDWKYSIPTIQGTTFQTGTAGVAAGGTFEIVLNTSDYTGLGDESIATITLTNDDGFGYATATGVAAAINNLDWANLGATVVDGKIQILSDVEETADSVPYVTITNPSSAAVLTGIGLAAGTYYLPSTTFGTTSQQPLWQASQPFPRPTGSVWVKVGSTGLNPVVSQYNTTVSAWINKTVTMSTSDWAASAVLGPTGGKTIPAGTIYGQYNYDGEYPFPLYLWERLATGSTVVTGAANPTVGVGYELRVWVSSPGSASLLGPYTVNLGGVTTVTDIVTAWSAASIPNTSAAVATTGALQLTHTQGGEIILDDTVAGVSTDFIVDMGFDPAATLGCKYGPSVVASFTPTEVGAGTLTINVTSAYGSYYVAPTTFVDAGSGYTVGQQITFSGTDLGGITPNNDLVVTITGVDGAGAVTSVIWFDGYPPVRYQTQLSNWVQFNYTANEGAPVATPADFTNWFYSVVDEVDIMVNYSGDWYGYKNINYDSNGFPTLTGVNATDPNGPIVSASEPTTQSDGTALVYGDLWVETADLENYPVIYRWQQVDTEDKWVLLDNTDQTSPTGIVFTDARWSSDQDTINPVDDPIPTIVSLLTSDNVDLDAPAPSLYPTGMLLFNTRRSGYNVKQFRRNYFNLVNFPGAGLPVFRDTWVSASGLQSNGAPYMGRKAQRAMVVKALKESIDTNLSIRDEDNFFNLMATPAYPELQPNMVVLNGDRGETCYILGDTPMGLPDDATAIQAWANNTAGATSTGEDGCVTRNTYLGLFYPSGIATDLSGNQVAVPASHMMLRTFLKNDTVSYPWLAAAGTRRGIIDNATNIGYIDRVTGEFQVIKTRLGIRDVLYTNFINPLVFFTGNGLLNYGNKTSYNSSSALDRTNVARLIAYMRRQLTLAARPYVFEPNDAFTRGQIAGTIETLMLDLVAKRGIYDYLVVCDESNNTPARIDRNELWVDVAIEPVKAAEFIYIPVRILNTGELAAI